MEIYDRKERDLSGLLLGSVSSLVCLDACGTPHPTAKCLVHDVMMFVYYYMKNFCNLIDWLRAVVFHLNLKYLQVKITNVCG